MTAPSIAHAGTLSAAGGSGGSTLLTEEEYFSAGAAGSPAVGYMGGVFAASGNSLSQLVSAVDTCGWGTLTFSSTVPEGTSLAVDVLDKSKNGLVEHAGRRLRCTPAGDFTSDEEGSQSPVLTDWSLGPIGL